MKKIKKIYKIKIKIKIKNKIKNKLKKNQIGGICSIHSLFFPLLQNCLQSINQFYSLKFQNIR